MVCINELFVDNYDHIKTKIDARSSYRLPLDSPLVLRLYGMNGRFTVYDIGYNILFLSRNSGRKFKKPQNNDRFFETKGLSDGSLYHDQAFCWF